MFKKFFSRFKEKEKAKIIPNIPKKLGQIEFTKSKIHLLVRKSFMVKYPNDWNVVHSRYDPLARLKLFNTSDPGVYSEILVHLLFIDIDDENHIRFSLTGPLELLGKPIALADLKDPVWHFDKYDNNTFRLSHIAMEWNGRYATPEDIAHPIL